MISNDKSSVTEIKPNVNIAVGDEHKLNSIEPTGGGPIGAQY